MIQLMITGLAAKMCCEPLGNSWDISSSVSAKSEPSSPTSVENLCSLPSASFFEEREHASLVIGNRHWPFLLRSGSVDDQFHGPSGNTIAERLVSHRKSCGVTQDGFGRATRSPSEHACAMGARR